MEVIRWKLLMRSVHFLKTAALARNADKCVRGIPADVFVVDMEDGVPFNQKQMQRDFLRMFLASDQMPTSTRLVLRINPLQRYGYEWAKDIEQLLYPKLDGLILTKVPSEQLGYGL